MAIYWHTPGLKGRTFKLCVLIRWDFNFCVRGSPLWGGGGEKRRADQENKGRCELVMVVWSSFTSVFTWVVLHVSRWPWYHGLYSCQSRLESWVFILDWRWLQWLSQGTEAKLQVLTLAFCPLSSVSLVGRPAWLGWTRGCEQHPLGSDTYYACAIFSW